MASSAKSSPSKEPKEAAKFKYQENEKVLCYHGPLLYEAKCIRSQFQEKQARYFIHYSGWNKNWDEWVPESRVLKYNETNLQKQKELEVAHLKTKKVKLTQKKKDSAKAEDKHRRSSAKGNSDENLTKKKKVRVEVHPEPEETKIQPELKIKVKIPFTLNNWIARDYNQIMRTNRLLSLPAKVTVDALLQNYCAQPITGRSSNLLRSRRQEVVNGVKDFFNISASNKLLYPNERKYYASIVKQYPDQPPIKIFGVAHLLRLFTKIGPMIDRIKLENEACVTLLTDHLHDLLNYISENCGYDEDEYFDIADE